MKHSSGDVGNSFRSAPLKKMSFVKRAAISLFQPLPLSIQKILVKNQPGWAFHIKSQRRTLLVDNYLGKYSVQVDMTSDIERRFISGWYEPETIAMIRRFVRHGQNCIDIGANVGAITIALADACGPNGIVHAFEPGPDYYTRLCKNLELNPDLNTRVKVHSVGLSDSPGQAPWQASSIYMGTASMYKAIRDMSRPTLKLPVVRLDDYNPIARLSSIGFVKIDVDGLELQILKGSTGTIRRHKPVLYVETTMWNDEMRAAAQEIELLLETLGYDLFKIDEKTLEITRTRFPDLSFNTLALPIA